MIEKALGIEVEGVPMEGINALIQDNKIACPRLKHSIWTSARHFNLMFSTEMSKTSDGETPDRAYFAQKLHKPSFWILKTSSTQQENGFHLVLLKSEKPFVMRSHQET